MLTNPDPRALPLIRRTATGWERLKIGGSFTTPPAYEPYTFDYATWLEKQQQAAKMREEGEGDWNV